MTSPVRAQVEAARAASRDLASLSTSVKNAALLRIAELLETEQSAVLTANTQDLEAAKDAGLEEYYIERMVLTPDRLKGIAADTRTVAALPDPVGEVFDGRTLPNGLQIGRRRVPLGVIACIYESRPNVTIDVAALALKSGNAAVLRGGSDAVRTNLALGALIADALEDAGIPANAVQVIRDTDRAYVDELLKMHELIDLMVPRGGASLIERVRDGATMPVVAGGMGVVHTYVDEGASIEMAVEVVDNAKTRRYSICNALDTLLVHRSVAGPLLQGLGEVWAGKVTLLPDQQTAGFVADFAPGVATELATPETWHTEHLALRCGVKVVDSLSEALTHIAMVNSGHSEAIITNNHANAMRFLNEVDAAAVYVNASTQFTDGAQFGLGAELGISTQKMHARGPIGLRELTSYKWTVMGSGQVRPL